MLVSIIMPAYNAEKYITEAIESVQNQTYANWELLVLDDGSSDNTPSIILKKCEEDKRIQFYQNAVNMGVAKTRNKGVELSRGEWIAFLDSDDKWDDQKLEKQMKAVEEHCDAALFFTASSFMSENGHPLSYILQVPEKVFYKDLLKQNVISCSSVLVKKDCLKAYPMPDMKLIHEDFAVWLQILKEGNYAVGINEPLLTYRLSANSKSGNKLKAARMNWNTYRYLKINYLLSVKYMFHYALRSLKKYSKLSR